MRTQRAPLRWAFVNNDPTLGPDLLHDYIDGWRRHDVPAVLSTLADDCVVVESDGPVYRGRERVEEWMTAWFAAGGRVHEWRITSSGSTGDLIVAEWEFTRTWRDVRSSCPGATIARAREGRIGYLREYATTADLYDWTGVWRD